jgi:broad specificity phosphatase PhoE
MSARLLLISHAATSATRRAGFPLDEGIEPVVGPKPGDLPRADRFCCAPERRTLETASLLGLTPEVEPLLRDIDLGDWAGRGFDEMLSVDPSGIAAWTKDPAAAPHGGETVENLCIRVSQWMEPQNRAGGRIIAVTHPAVIRAAIAFALEVDPLGFWRIDIGPLTQVDLRGDGRRWNLRGISGRD